MKNIHESNQERLKTRKIQYIIIRGSFGNIKDTVYTDKETWFELKIDQQMLYQHWRDGHVENIRFLLRQQ